MIEKEDWVKAKGTTLGADDGMGVDIVNMVRWKH